MPSLVVGRRNTDEGRNDQDRYEFAWHLLNTAMPEQRRDQNGS
jgi:hypothetical protein